MNDNDVMADAGENVGKLLHGAAVFGANASGKSNVVKAFSTFRWLVANSLMNVLGGEYQQVESFRLSRETVTKPSFFEIVFCAADLIYRYGVEIDSVRVWREWLYQKRAKEMELFFREGEAIAIHPKLGIVAFSKYADLGVDNIEKVNDIVVSHHTQFDADGNETSRASELYSLAEYKVRSNASFEKEYLAGKYGAIPIVGNLSRVLP